MKIYVEYNGEICELNKYQNVQGKVILNSPSEGWLGVQKKDVKIVGFRNGKGATGELEVTRKDGIAIEHEINEVFPQERLL